jgi:hypothetical protein
LNLQHDGTALHSLKSRVLIGLKHFLEHDFSSSRNRQAAIVSASLRQAAGMLLLGRSAILAKVQTNKANPQTHVMFLDDGFTPEKVPFSRLASGVANHFFPAAPRLLSLERCRKNLGLGHTTPNTCQL